MLKSYPDYNKTPPEYLASIINAFAEYPESLQIQLAHPTRGIRGRSDFLPTNAVVVKMADEIIRQESADRAFNLRFPVGRTVVDAVVKPFVPFPQLWRAFADEPELLKAQTFERLDAACKALVTVSKSEAKYILQNA